MKRLLFFLILTGSNISFAETIFLSLGETKVIPLSGSHVWIQDRDIVTAEATGSSLRISGKKEGATNIKVGKNLYEIQVSHPNHQQHFQVFKNIVKDCVGLEASIQQGQLTVHGTLYKISDWLKISAYAKKAQITYQLQAQISEPLKVQIQRHISDLQADTHYANQNVIFAPRLEVRMKASETHFLNQKKQLGHLGITVIKDETSIDIAPTVKVEITIAEVKKSNSLKYGLEWPAAYKAQILNGQAFQKEALEFSLAALEIDGTAKILASPNIIARSGEQAEFVAGGEFPIKIVNYKMQDIIWKKYGILLRVKPKADSSGRMSISIETEVSTIDSSREVESIPGLLTNKVSSHFDISRPQTIALSGLIKNEDGNSSGGLPGLGRLPILGALFSSKDFKSNRSELVIFVRPSILSENDQEKKTTLNHLSGGPS